MDAIDRKILSVVQEDASLSVAEIGQRVGLSSTPCWKRLQRLEADGVITRRVAIIDPEKVGLGITVFVSIETGDHSQDWLKRFADVVGAMPEVMEFYRMAGDVDYMLRVVVPDIAGYDAFYKKLIATVPLKNVTSRFAMERIKSTTGCQLPRPGNGPLGRAAYCNAITLMTAGPRMTTNSTGRKKRIIGTVSFGGSPAAFFSASDMRMSRFSCAITRNMVASGVP
jgi:Lrp/AsnC family transcriptional regulator